ncbi:autotransporter-associated beta strand repeat-containing protein [Prosthecobacter sp.]|uniref:beta strand repeat-containing protein n=1 Tax=Prosthecobacter sp. TaxID=1965333 RepID=UPI0024889EA2|nr:autotransporter-associated beta strand repeat-containing protein [Prosthecobacter sp.]MDI1312192.1 autotransporter-associated beta strand repeat-containing protein [Prosthecobacter sp.]
MMTSDSAPSPSARQRDLRSFSLGLLAFVLLACPLNAVDFNWTGTTSSDFTVGTNWSGNTAPSPTGGGVASPVPWRISVGGTTNTLVYSAAQGHTVLSGGSSDRALFIANGTNGSMSITGGIFESTSSALDGMTNSTNAAGLLSIDGGTYRKTTGNGGASTFAVFYGGAGLAHATLDINSGSFEVTTLDLQNNGATSTQTDGTPESLVNLDGGTLSVGTIIRTNTSAGIDAVLNFNGGTLQARQDSTTFLANLGQFTANVQAGGALIDTQAFNITIAAPLVHDVALGGTADGGLTKVGAGALTLAGASTYTGGTFIKNGMLILSTGNDRLPTGTVLTLGDGSSNDSGVLKLDSRSQTLAGLLTAGTGTGNSVINGNATATAATLTLSINVSNLFGGVLGGAGTNENNFGLTKTGAGVLTLSGINTYSGATNILAGTLQAGAAGGGTVFGVNSAITLADAAGVVLDLNGFSQTVGSLAGGGSTGGQVTLGSAVLTLGGSNASTTFAGIISGVGGTLIKTGTGTLTLSGANTYTGLTTVSAGVLTVASNTALGGTAGGTSVANGATLVLANGIKVTGETVGISGSGGNSMGALQTVAGGAAEWAGVVTIEAGGTRLGALAGGVLTVSGGIQNGASNSLFISGEAGTGTVLISGTGNTYTGATQIIRGILKLGSTNALPTTTVLDVDSLGSIGVNDDATFDLNGFNQTVAALQRTGTSFGTGNSYITNSSTTGATLTVSSTSTTSYSGVIQNGAGVVNLTLSGGGSLTLSGDNTYTGLTTLSGANSALVVGSNTALGGTSGGTNVGSGSRVVLANGVTVTGETITITSTGGNNNGALQTASGASAEWAGNIIVTGSDARIGGGVGGTLTVSGVISGSAPILFSRADNSTTILNAVNTYTGDTQLFSNGSATGSYLIIGVDNAINAASRLSVISNAPATKPITLDLNSHVLTLRGLDTSAYHESGAVLSVANNAAATASVLTISDPAANTTYFTGTLKDGTSGAGGLSLVKSGNNTQVLIGANTYTGSTTINSGTLQVGGAVSTYGASGSLASTRFLFNGGFLTLDNTGASNNNANRLADAADFAFQGGSFIYKGSNQAATNSSETLHNLTVNSGLKTLSVIFGGTNVATLNANQITRPAQGGLLLVNGTNLGMDSTSTASVARVLFTTAPELVGATAALSTGINLASKDTQIVPFLLGEVTLATGGTGTATGTPNTFLTYNATTGLRPLNPIDEFTQNAISTGNNTRVTTGTSVSVSDAINSLILDGASVTIGSGRTLTVTSGAILFTTGSGIGISGGTLDFGTREGLVTINSLSNTIISSVITGSAGVTYSGTGTLVLATQQNTYGGNTLLQVALVIPQSSSTGPAGAPTSGPFGQGTVIFNGSAIRATTSNDIIVDNNVQFNADTTVVSSGTPSLDKVLTFTGNVTLSGASRTITHSSGANTIFSGTISDAGNNLGLTIAGSGLGAVVLSGTSTYTGPTQVNGSTLQVGSNGIGTSGTGAVTVASGATLAGSGSVQGATVMNSGSVLQPGDVTASGNASTLVTNNSTLTFTAANTALTVNNGAQIRLGISSPTLPSNVISFSAGMYQYNGQDYGSALALFSNESGALSIWNTSPSNVSNHDFIKLTDAAGTLSIGDRAGGAWGQGSVVVNSSLGSVAVGQVFNLIDWNGAAISGNFDVGGLTFVDASGNAIAGDLDLALLGAGFSWDVSAFQTYGIIVVVPEPGRTCLLLLGLLGLGLRRWR